MTTEKTFRQSVRTALTFSCLVIAISSGCKKGGDAAERCRNTDSYLESDKATKLANCMAACSSGEKWACDMATSLQGKSSNDAAERCRNEGNFTDSDKASKLANCLAACSAGEKWACQMAEQLKGGATGADGSNIPAKFQGTWWACSDSPTGDDHKVVLTSTTYTRTSLDNKGKFQYSRSATIASAAEDGPALKITLSKEEAKKATIDENERNWTLLLEGESLTFNGGGLLVDGTYTKAPCKDRSGKAAGK